MPSLNTLRQLVRDEITQRTEEGADTAGWGRLDKASGFRHARWIKRGKPLHLDARPAEVPSRALILGQGFEPL